MQATELNAYRDYITIARYVGKKGWRVMLHDSRRALLKQSEMHALARSRHRAVAVFRTSSRLGVLRHIPLPCVNTRSLHVPVAGARVDAGEDQ
eukprot:9330138-Pyramimonas_sp.AAC.1